MYVDIGKNIFKKLKIIVDIILDMVYIISIKSN